jgi:hypothetical protein
LALFRVETREPIAGLQKSDGMQDGVRFKLTDAHRPGEPERHEPLVGRQSHQNRRRAAASISADILSASGRAVDSGELKVKSDGAARSPESGSNESDAAA